MGNKCAPCFGKTKDFDQVGDRIQSKLEGLE